MMKMKNYVAKEQKLPLFGIGPYLVFAMALLTLVGIVLSGNVLRSGIVSGVWIILFRVVGGLLIVIGASVWFIGAMRSDMDESITENRLKTDGIYAWVRNPMYSGWWMIIAGIGLMWHNLWLVVIPFINWVIMTIVLIKTEEKWLLDLYGAEYGDYKKRVNRCIPWKPKDNR